MRERERSDKEDCPLILLLNRQQLQQPICVTTMRILASSLAKLTARVFVLLVLQFLSHFTSYLPRSAVFSAPLLGHALWQRTVRRRVVKSCAAFGHSLHSYAAISHEKVASHRPRHCTNSHSGEKICCVWVYLLCRKRRAFKSPAHFVFSHRKRCYRDRELVPQLRGLSRYQGKSPPLFLA